MTRLNFYTEFMEHDNVLWGNNYDQPDHYVDSPAPAQTSNIFRWLYHRTVAWLTFSREKVPNSLFLHWMYYFNRANSPKFGELLITPPIAAIYLFVMLSVIGGIICTASVPLAVLLPSLLQVFMISLFTSVAVMLCMYALFSVFMLIVEIGATISYFISAMQWRKTATVVDYLLNTLLDTTVNVQKMYKHASAIRVIHGKERQHCAYAIIDAVCCSTCTDNLTVAKKFLSLIRAFHTMGLFKHYLVTNSEESPRPILPGEWWNGAIQYHRISIQTNSDLKDNGNTFQIHATEADMESRQNFYASRYNIAKIEAIARRAGTLDEKNLSDDGCKAVVEFFNSIRDIEDHFDQKLTECNTQLNILLRTAQPATESKAGAKQVSNDGDSKSYTFKRLHLAYDAKNNKMVTSSATEKKQSLSSSSPRKSIFKPPTLP